MAHTPSSMLPLGTKAPQFRLPDTEGKMRSLEEFKNAKGYLVMFICNHCPFVIHVRPAIITLAREFQEKGFAVIAIASNDIKAYPQDGPAAMKEEALRHGFTFPYVFDETQDVAKAYQAACTPDFYLFDARQVLVYRGQMDDSRPSNNKPNDGKDLRLAMESVLAGKTPPRDQKPSMGCNIKWKPGNEPEYYG
ncbi:MAG: thioredoxin family protein [Deltaproteobacteria bacterium]|nr:thioredoxin family protein [Deltaproteobacteria bacterium]